MQGIVLQCANTLTVPWDCPLSSLTSVNCKENQSCSGHGPQMENPRTNIDAARDRLDKWIKAPEKVSWHACKKIFAFTLIMKNGLAKEEIDHYPITFGPND
jgi:hypothetical protein